MSWHPSDRRGDIRGLTAASLLLALSACATTPEPSAPAAPRAASFTGPLWLTGTEPFWGGRIGPDAITLTGAERPELRLPAVTPAVSGDTARWRTPADVAAGAAPVSVLITATQPGASAETLERTVTTVIERALGGLDGVYRVQSASMDGRAVTTVGYLPGQTAEARAAAVRASLARLRLPARAGAEVTLAQPQALEIALVRRTCSDGMSDRVYPMEANVTLGSETLRGCAGPESLFNAQR